MVVNSIFLRKIYLDYFYIFHALFYAHYHRFELKSNILNIQNVSGKNTHFTKKYDLLQYRITEIFFIQLGIKGGSRRGVWGHRAMAPQSAKIVMKIGPHNCLYPMCFQYVALSNWKSQGCLCLIFFIFCVNASKVNSKVKTKIQQHLLVIKSKFRFLQYFEVKKMIKC